MSPVFSYDQRRYKRGKKAESVKDLAKPTVTLIFPCPNCKTIVSTQDIDVFGRCPECEYDFEELDA